MFSFLKNHPFAVEAYFENSIVLTFAFPKRELEQFIPECLTLDVFKNEWAFLAVAFVKTKYLRPKGFSKILGNDFMLIGYRIFVRYTNIAGKRLRGLYILKSETDKKSMDILGQIFTHYNYETTDIKQVQNNNQWSISSVHSNFNMQFEEGAGNIALPPGSPFSDWKEARRFAGPLPFTFYYIKEKKQILIIEGVRENWVPKAIKVMNYHIPFLNSAGLANERLANSFIIKDIPYHWKKGRIERWNS